MPTQTCRASKDSPGFVLIIEKGQVVTSFYCWDVTSVYKNKDPDYVRGPTVIGFRRTDDDGWWLATFCSVAAVQAAIDAAVEVRKKARPLTVSVSDLRDAVEASG